MKMNIATISMGLQCCDLICSQRDASAVVHVSAHQLSPPADSPSAGRPVGMGLVLSGILSSIVPLSAKDKRNSYHS